MHHPVFLTRNILKSIDSAYIKILRKKINLYLLPYHSNNRYAVNNVKPHILYSESNKEVFLTLIVYLSNIHFSGFYIT